MNKKIEIFSKRLFGWCKDREKMKNLRFMGRGIEASESAFTKKKRHPTFSVLFA